MNYNPEINYNEEPITIYVDNISYLRTGYCCQCGQCCIGHNPPTTRCPMFLWVEENVRGICIDQENQICGQDKHCWPECPANIEHYPKCTYKFEITNSL